MKRLGLLVLLTLPFLLLFSLLTTQSQAQQTIQFTDSGQEIGNGDSTDVALGDIDDDGAVVAASNGRAGLHLDGAAAPVSSGR